VPGETQLRERVAAAGHPGEPVGLYLSRTGWLTSLLFPNGGPDQVLASKRVERISLDYPEVSYNFLGIQLSWITIFLIVSMVVGYIGSRFLGVAV
jgi:hypothetical protein